MARYQEVLKKEQKTPLMGILYIVCMVASLFLAVIVSNLLYNLLHILYLHYIIYILTAVFVIRLMKNDMSSYLYTLQKEQLWLERQIGKRLVGLIQINTADIVWFGFYKEYPNAIRHMSHFTYLKKATGRCIIYKNGQKTKAVLFHPSEKLVLLINEALNMKK